MLAPICTAALLRPLLAELLALLRDLTPAQWELPTVAGRWRVRDVAAHLLDGDLRKLAVYRDGHALPLDTPIASDSDLLRFINGLNASGVAWATRLSPRLICELLAVTGGWVAEVLEALPPHGRSLFPVSWAGEVESENWMDTGREYTERWHHQMQIRDAVGAPPVLLERRWLDPLLDISVRALPHAYAEVDAATGVSVIFEVMEEEADDAAHVRVGARRMVGCALGGAVDAASGAGGQRRGGRSRDPRRGVAAAVQCRARAGAGAGDSHHGRQSAGGAAAAGAIGDRYASRRFAPVCDDRKPRDMMQEGH